MRQRIQTVQQTKATKFNIVLLQYQLKTWLRKKDSNPHKQSQSLLCYRYTIPQSLYKHYTKPHYLCQLLNNIFKIKFQKIEYPGHRLNKN